MLPETTMAKAQFNQLKIIKQIMIKSDKLKEAQMTMAKKPQ